MTSTHRRIIDVAVTMVLSGVIIWGFWSFFRGEIIFDLFSNDSSSFRAYLTGLDSFASMVIYLLLIILEGLIAFIPGWFVYPVGAAIFGFSKTMGLVLCGNLIAASISFWIGRKWGTVLLEKFVAPKYISQFNQYVESKGSWALFLLKINPVTSFDVWNYVAGASSMRFWKFTLSNMLGILPLVAVSTLLGEGSYNVAPQLLGVLALMTVLYVIWFFVNLPRRIKGHRAKTP